MKRYRQVFRRSAGFTLIEVLVAFSILSLTLATLFSLLSTGARSTRVADEYGEAVVWAESKLAELGVSEPLRVGTRRGSFDARYRWELRIAKRLPHDISVMRENEWDLLDVSLRVWWGSVGGERDLAISTARLVARD